MWQNTEQKYLHIAIPLTGPTSQDFRGYYHPVVGAFTPKKLCSAVNSALVRICAQMGVKREPCVLVSWGNKSEENCNVLGINPERRCADIMHLNEVFFYRL
jgi:hypothetical protein